MKAKAKRKKCTNCAYHEEFKYSTYDTQVQMRCWKHPDVCDHAFVQSMEDAENSVCSEYTSYDEKAEMDYREAKFEYNMAKNCIATLEKKYPELKEICAMQGAQWADKTMIEKACEWLKDNIYNRVYKCGDDLGFPTAQFIEDFRKAMEG